MIELLIAAMLVEIPAVAVPAAGGRDAPVADGRVLHSLFEDEHGR